MLIKVVIVGSNLDLLDKFINLGLFLYSYLNSIIQLGRGFTRFSFSKDIL